MKTIIYLVLMLSGIHFSLIGQSQLEKTGINYQGIAFDSLGKPLRNLPLQIKVSLSKKGEQNQVFYSESHLSNTDETGIFNLIIGKGTYPEGRLIDIPWGTDKIHLDVSIRSTNSIKYAVSHSTQIQAVPYAYYANKSGKILQENTSMLEKNQSIRWTTSGG